MMTFNSFETANNWLTRAEFDHVGSDGRLGEIYQNCYGDRMRLVYDDFRAMFTVDLHS